MAEWDLKQIFNGKTEEQIEAETKEKVEKFTKIRDELTDSLTPARIKEILQLKEEIRVLLSSQQSYYGLKFTENTKDQAVLGKLTYYEQLGTQLSNQMIFFGLWIMALKDDVAQKFIDAEELKEYSYYIQRLRLLKNYAKTEEVEQILNLKSTTIDGFSNIYDIITNAFTFDFEDQKGITQEELKVYVFDTDPKRREEAYKSMFTPYKQNDVLLSEIYKNIVLDWYNEGVTIRGYKSPISVRSTSQNISEEAVTTLLNVVRDNANTFVEYFRLKREINLKLGANYPFSRFHLYAPYQKHEIKKYSYDESKKIVLDTYKEFDQRFHDHAKKIFDDNHVHSHPKANKRSGAFCSTLHRNISPYILLNHADALRDVFTMMHEFGHGIHSLFAFKQVDLLVSPQLPMAETASIFGEMVLADKMLKSAQDEEKKSILMYLLDNQWASIIRQAYFVIFEKEAHEKIKNGATKEELDNLYYTLLQEQFGDMQIDECFKQEWNYIPHIHHSPFYCYAYAWGNLLVLALFDMYRKEGQSFKEKYIKLLSAGGSQKPADILAELDIDVKDKAFWQRGFDVIKEEIEELKELVS